MKMMPIVGLAVGLTVASSTAAQAARITLDFDAFIPAERIDNPAAEVLPPFFSEFSGDNRGFSLEATRSGQSRLFSQVVIDTESPDLVVSSFVEGGTSTGFLQQNGIEISQSAPVPAKGNFTATRVDDRTINLVATARATNPLITNFLPPNVDVAPAEFSYDIDLTLLDDGIGYELEGMTRAYPNYSVFLNGASILQNRTEHANRPELLEIVEPVSGRGKVSVDEPANVLGLSLVALCAIATFGSKRRDRTSF